MQTKVPRHLLVPDMIKKLVLDKKNKAVSVLCEIYLHTHFLVQTKVPPHLLVPDMIKKWRWARRIAVGVLFAYTAHPFTHTHFLVQTKESPHLLVPDMILKRKWQWTRRIRAGRRPWYCLHFGCQAKSARISFPPPPFFPPFIYTPYLRAHAFKIVSPYAHPFTHALLLMQTKVPSHLLVPDMMEKMAVDKKNKGGKKAVVLLQCVGEVKEKIPVLVEDDVIERVLSEYVCVMPPGAGMFQWSRNSKRKENVFLG